MSKFNLVAAVDRLSKPMMLENLDCNKELNLVELKDFISEQGIVQESVSDFIKSSREYLSHGSFPMWARIADKEDENGDGKIDDADKKGYIAKVIAGLYFYMKKDLRNSDEDAFKMVVNNLTKHNIDKNVKSQVEKNAQLAKFVDNVVANYEDPATKQKLHKYLNALQDYYLSDLPAKMTEAVNLSDEQAAKMIFDKIKGTPDLNRVKVEQYVTKYLSMVGKAPTDVKYLTAIVYSDLKDMDLAEAVNLSDEQAAKMIFDKIKGTPNLNLVNVEKLVTKYLGMVGKAPTDVKYLTAIVYSDLKELDLAESKNTSSPDKINNPDYAFYVVGKNKIISGWEYREDAKDALEDTPGVDAKVYSKVTLKKLGLDADNNSDWANQADLT